MNSALADRFYLVAPDLRGHGASDKPDAPSAYDTSTPWANDIQAIIDHYGLTKTVLVGWSMGGKILLDYLRIHGDSALAGVAHVGSSVTSGKFTNPEAAKLRASPAVAAKGMYGDDLGENLAATMAFLTACTAKPLPRDEFAMMVGYNMLCPPHIRVPSRKRNEDYRADAQECRVPALIIWGDQELVMPRVLFDESCANFADPEPVVFPDCGHATFWEAPEKFNQTLADFADRAFERCAA